MDTTESSGETLSLKISLFETVYDAYQADRERFWKVFQSLSVVNGGLLFAVSISAEQPAFWIIAGLVGMLLCSTWSGMQFRYAAWASWYEDELAETEKKLQKHVDEADAIKTFGKQTEPGTLEEYVAAKRKCSGSYGPVRRGLHWRRGFSTKRSPALLAAVLAVAWCLAIAYGVYMWVAMGQQT
jgi:hypothetical protein